MGPAPILEPCGLSTDQVIAHRLLSDPAHGLPPPALDRSIWDLADDLGPARFADALIRLETTFAIDLDPDEAVASGDVAGLLALVHGKTRPGRAPIRRPGHVEVYDMAAYRAAIGQPIEAGRFAHWTSPRLRLVVGAPEPQGPVIEEPAPEAPEPSAREPDLVLDPAVLALAFPDAAEAAAPPTATPHDYAAATVKAALIAMALVMAASALAPPAIPSETPAQVALRDAVR